MLWIVLQRQTCVKNRKLKDIPRVSIFYFLSRLTLFSSGVRAYHFRGTRHFRNEKETGAKMRPAIFSGIVTADAPRSLCKSSIRLSSRLVSKVANFGGILH